MFRNLASVRGVLTILLVLAVLFAGYGIYYKIRYWGFSFTPGQNTNLWSVEAHISFMPTGEPIKVTLTTPRSNDAFKILEENVIAPEYQVKRNKSGSLLTLTSSPKEGEQNLYYKIMLFDNVDTKGKLRAPQPEPPALPVFDEQKTAEAKQILKLAQKQGGDAVAQVIKLLNKEPLDPAVQAYLPVKYTQTQ